MNMAKATEKDMDAAMRLLGILIDVDSGRFPRGKDGEISEKDPEYFDEDPDSDVLALHPRFGIIGAALLKAKETIKALHGDVAWDIYDAHSPEMKQINEAISLLKG